MFRKLAICLAFVAFSCPSPEPEPEPDNVVTLEGFRFNPENLTISVGDTVVWEHRQGDVPHTVTSGEVGAADGIFDSRDGDPNARMREPDTFQHTFTEPGTFAYHCVVHGGNGMVGTITVEP